MGSTPVKCLLYTDEPVYGHLRQFHKHGCVKRGISRGTELK